MHFEIIKNLKPPVGRKLAVRQTKLVCLTASFCLLVVSSNYFTKFHDLSIIIQVFFKFYDFSMHGTFFGDFPRFPELVQTLYNLLVTVKEATLIFISGRESVISLCV